MKLVICLYVFSFFFYIFLVLFAWNVGLLSNVIRRCCSVYDIFLLLLSYLIVHSVTSMKNCLAKFCYRRNNVFSGFSYEEDSIRKVSHFNIGPVIFVMTFTKIWVYIASTLRPFQGTGCLEILTLDYESATVWSLFPSWLVLFIYGLFNDTSVAQLTECQTRTQLMNNRLKQCGNKVVPWHEVISQHSHGWTATSRPTEKVSSELMLRAFVCEVTFSNLDRINRYSDWRFSFWWVTR
jgi:hypothetical protein